MKSNLEVIVLNTPPTFVNRPAEAAEASQLYEAVVKVQDNGPADVIRLDVSEGPEGLTVETLSRGEFKLSWMVPDEAGGLDDVVLVAEDGQYIDEQWTADGGKATLKLTIDVAPLVVVDAFIPPRMRTSLHLMRSKAMISGVTRLGAKFTVDHHPVNRIFALPWGRRRRG